MKRALSLLLCVMLCISALGACTTDTPDTSGSDASIGTPNADISYDDVSYFIPGGTSKPEESQPNYSKPEESRPEESRSSESNDSSESNTSIETSQPTETSKSEQQTGGFAIKLAKYTYESNTIALLNITNETEKNYSITIHGSYLDANGKVMKTETQKWEQFGAGYQKFFLFKPDIQFDRFTYSVETAEYKGQCPVCELEVKSVELTKEKWPVAKLCDQGDRTSYPQIIAKIHTQNNSNKTLIAEKSYLITFGSDGEIYNIDLSGSKKYIPDFETYRSVMIAYSTEDTIELPKELKDKVNFIVVFTEITVEE